MMRSALALAGSRTIRPQFMNRMLFQIRNNSNLTESLKSTRAFPQDFPPSDGTEIPKIAETIAESIEFGANTPVGWIENGLDLFHSSGDFSWGFTIIAGTVLMRALLLPVAVKGQVESMKIQAIKPSLIPIQERLQKARKIGDQVAVQAETQKIAKLFKEHKINPFKGFLGLIQIPFFISFFLAVSKMGHGNISGFEDGGYGWLSNLSATDPTLIAPLSIPLIAYWTMAVNEKSNPGAVPSIMKNVMVGVMFLGLYFTISLPAAVYYYLIPSIVMSGFQTMLFNNPKFRIAFGLPIVEKQPLPSHDTLNLKSVSAIRPMKMSEAFNEAKEAIKTLQRQKN